MSISQAPACPLCGTTCTSVAPNPMVPRPDLMMYCDDCGLAYARVMLTAGQSWYSDSGLYAAPLENSLDWRERTFFSTVRPSATHRLLDVGCADGRFLRHASDRGWQTYGLDINPANVERATTLRHLSRITCGDIELCGPEILAPGFDAITAFEILEHLRDPIAVLRKLFAALMPGGLLMFSVPRLDRYPALFDPVIDAPPHHLTLWTTNALRRLCKCAAVPPPHILVPPLDPRDIYLHMRWRRYGAGTTRNFSIAMQLLIKPALVLSVYIARFLSLARGHTLMCLVRRPPGAFSE